MQTSPITETPASTTPPLLSSSSASLEQLESRLAQLEFKLGTAPSANTAPASSYYTTANNDVTSRVDKLLKGLSPSSKSIVDSSTTISSAITTASMKQREEAKRMALHQEFQTIDRLLGELSFTPLAGPTAASSISSGGSGSGSATIGEAPLLFRKMEILSTAESMKRDMDLLARIRDLTSIGTKSTAGGSAAVTTTTASTVDHANCPIISSERYNLPSDPEQVDRLERVCHRVANLHQRSAGIALRVDSLLDCYSEVMGALSEKIVLAEEQIRG